MRSVRVVVLAGALATLPAGGCAGVPDGDAAAPRAGDTVVDPVCGRETAVFAGGAVAQHAGRTYHFCAASCAATCDRDPGRHASR
jgi:YHS domain-containing protein